MKEKVNLDTVPGLKELKEKTYLGGSTHNKCLLNDSIITWGENSNLYNLCDNQCSQRQSGK